MQTKKFISRLLLSIHSDFYIRIKLSVAFLVVFFSLYMLISVHVSQQHLAQSPQGCEQHSNCSWLEDVDRNLVRKLPNCIIIGVRKSGTRALLEFLDIHPDIKKVIDELHFFDEDSKYEQGLEWYRQQMPLSRAEHVVIEKTPAYYTTDGVPERIYAMNSSLKLLLIVRDPVTRLISDYAQLASNRAVKQMRVESFEDVVLLPNGHINTNYKGVRISQYAVFFHKWIKLFSKHQIHVIDGDQFVYDPVPELRKVESFLGLSHYIQADHFVYNITKGFYCIRLNETASKCLNKNKGRKHPTINPLIIHRLRRFYDSYNRHFYKLIGHKFSWPSSI